MTAFILSVPSKTFLLGEYIVTQGGPALILATVPRFTLFAKEKTGEACGIPGIHPDAPAGKLMGQYKNLCKQFDLEFIDPHHGAGGFGASGAQFLMINSLGEYLENRKINPDNLLEVYRSLAFSGKGLPPSGADLIAQQQGGICYFHKKMNQIKKFSWPFPDLDYCLIHTGKKLATHHHLEKSGDLKLEGLADIVQKGLGSIQQGNSKNFIEVIQAYAEKLNSLDLVATHTQEILAQFADYPEILAAKGCGALGADVILVLIERNNDEIIHRLKKMNVHIVVYGHTVEKGIEIVEIGNE